MRLENITNGVAENIQSEIPSGVSRKNEYSCIDRDFGYGGTSNCSADAIFGGRENNVYDQDSLDRINGILDKDGWSAFNKNKGGDFRYEKSFFPKVNCIAIGSTEKEREVRQNNGEVINKPAEYSVVIQCQEDIFDF